VFFSPLPEKVSLASEITISGCMTFSSQIGFQIIAKSKSIKNTAALPYYVSLIRSWRNADVLLAMYPYFCYPAFKSNPFRRLDDWVLRLLHRIGDHVRSILYVVDLPLEQLRSVQRSELIDKKASRVESLVFDSFDVLCVFNEFMKNSIIKRYSLPSSRFVQFQFLDRISSCLPPARREFDRDNCTIVYTGSWDRFYVGDWVKDLPRSESVSYELFGRNWDWVTSIGRSDISPLGCYSDDDLLDHISTRANFGIIHMPSSRIEYAKNGTTSKLGTYLVAGLPILVGSDCTYIASLVKQYRIGCVFDSLSEIPSLVRDLSQSDYSEIRSNCLELGQKLKQGYFFKKAVIASLDKLGALQT
jgi:hypothetical protein